MAQRIEQVLSEQGRGFFQTAGDSMEPLLHSRKSTVVLTAARGPLKRYDVALYRRPAGEYVLHRVIGVTESGYRTLGDNRLWPETVPAEWVIGVMAGFYPDESGQYISCQSPAYRAYLKTLRLRRARLWFRALPGRVRRKMFGPRG
ncbi:MAG TPA: S24/S26 family peptidase [Candidatus Faecalibacterium intestinipullorum]|mgnify:CR=1 FL=1|nr:S24/S26 family peptidase [Faecalibacterium gallinarum]HIV50137.1 S24/S26 family peptidase [Candidatus Faecalibacterium intestinipullorum]